MKREVKFKVWNPQKNTMSIGMDLFTFAGYLTALYPYLKDEEFIEFTGLKDKNGKEIYEGDIVKLGQNQWTVKWKELTDLHETEGCGVGFEVFDGVEVIGNIYENKGL